MNEIIDCLKKILIQVDKWGDMKKSDYDPNADEVVKDSDKLEGSTKAQVQDHTPKAHTLASHSTKAHSELTGVSADQHHAQAHKLDSHTDPDGILTTKGALLKTGTQTEGRCHAAISAQAVNEGMQVSVCFREELANIPSSITLSDVGTTQDVNLAGGYPQVMRISKFGFGFMIRAAAAGDSLSGNKKFLTVGN